MPWQDGLMPVAQNTTIAERAVLECLYAGCSSIVVVCDEDMQPLLKMRIGEFGLVPHFHKNERPQFYKRCAIYYVSLHPKDLKRAGTVWDILWGALSSNYLCHKFSDWLRPLKFYVAFPYSVIPYEQAALQRKCLRSRKNLLFSYQGKTVRDNEYLGFSFDNYDLMVFLQKIKEIENEWRSKYNQAGKKINYGKMPTKNVSLEQIFGLARYPSDVVQELDWYYRLDSWEQYCRYLGSEERKKTESSEHGYLLNGYVWGINIWGQNVQISEEADDLSGEQEEEQEDKDDALFEESFDLDDIDPEKIKQIMEEDYDEEH